MHFLSAKRRKIGLRLLDLKEFRAPGGYGPEYEVSGSEQSARFSELTTGAARMMFELGGDRSLRAARQESGPLPAVFEDDSGLLRIVFKEIAVRFRNDTSSEARKKILGKYGFAIRRKSPYVRDQILVYQPERKYAGADLIDVANDWAEMEEVVFASPNFVSEYRRTALAKIHPEQWHLWNRGRVAGQAKGEDANIREAWKTSTGNAHVIVAVLDDGVDVDHPNLKARIVKDPDPKDPKDKHGRDFFVPSSSPEHYDPRPKVFKYPFDQMAGNDIHGTPCAGVAAAAGSRDNVRGAAPGCRLLPVKIFHADYIASDARVADAMRYAGRIADILSCSWGGPWSPDVELAVEDIASGRGKKGVAVFCATGNGSANQVDFPAALDGTIAVGASTDQGARAWYSNQGPEISVVAPSNGGVRGIYITDVSYANRGFNVGDKSAGGKDGLHTNDFGGTSSATPLAVGVGALVVSVNPTLTREELRGVLERTAEKIGSGYDASGHSPEFGYGRVDAGAAVEEALKLPGASAAKKKPKKAKTRKRAARAKKK